MTHLRTLLPMLALGLVVYPASAGLYDIDPTTSQLTLDSVQFRIQAPGMPPTNQVFIGAPQAGGDTAALDGFLDIGTDGTSLTFLGGTIDAIPSGSYVPDSGLGATPEPGDFAFDVSLGGFPPAVISAVIRDLVAGVVGTVPLIGSTFDTLGLTANFSDGDVFFTNNGIFPASLLAPASDPFPGDTFGLASAPGTFDTAGIPTISLPFVFDQVIEIVPQIDLDPGPGEFLVSVDLEVSGTGVINAQVPEIDPSASGAAVCVLVGVSLLLGYRRRGAAIAT